MTTGCPARASPVATALPMLPIPMIPAFVICAVMCLSSFYGVLHLAGSDTISKYQRLDLPETACLEQLIQYWRRCRCIQIKQANSLTTGSFTAKRKVGNIDPACP